MAEHWGWNNFRARQKEKDREVARGKAKTAIEQAEQDANDAFDRLKRNRRLDYKQKALQDIWEAVNRLQAEQDAEASQDE